MVHIYIIVNKLNGKFYVGKTAYTLRKRWNQHRYSAKTGQPQYLYKSMRKYNEESFDICKIDETSTLEKSSELEKYYIQQFSSHLPVYGYNLTLGGEGVTGNAETRAKISTTLKKLGIRPPGCTPEQHARGFKIDPEVVAARNAKMRGRPLSEAHKKALRVPKSKPSCNKGVFLRTDIPINEILAMYAEGKSSIYIGRWFNISRGAICKRLRYAGVELRPSRSGKVSKTNTN